MVASHSQGSPHPFSFDEADEFIWDKATGRYRFRTGAAKGQFAPRTAVLALTRANIQARSQELIDLGDSLSNGDIDLLDFQLSAAKLLKRIHVQSSILGASGIDNMTDADWLRVGRTLKTQFRSGKDPTTGKRFGLKWLANDIKQGTVTPAQLRYRLGLYAKSGMLSYYQSQAAKQKSQGMTEVRRLLGVTDDHCPECVGYHQQGWVTIADLVLPGTQCSCKHNCLCSLEFR